MADFEKLIGRLKAATRSGRGVRLSSLEINLLLGSYVPLCSGDVIKDTLHCNGVATGISMLSHADLNDAFSAAYGLDIDEVIDVTDGYDGDLTDRQAALSGLDAFTATAEDLDEWVMQYWKIKRENPFSNGGPHDPHPPKA